MGIEAAIAIIGAASSIIGGRAARKDAKRQAAETERLGRENAANIEAETMEQKRRAEEEASEQMAMNRARAAASGVESEEGSFDIFLGAEQDKFKSEIDWLVKSGMNQSRYAVSQAQSQANAIRSQGKAAAKQGMTGAITSLGTAYAGGAFAGGTPGQVVTNAPAGYTLGAGADNITTALPVNPSYTLGAGVSGISDNPFVMTKPW